MTGKIFEEERLLPLPRELCVGMNVEEGTALYVTYGANPDPLNSRDQQNAPANEQSPESWGDDLAGWIAIAPFPPKLLASQRLQKFGVHFKNFPGAFRHGVTQPIAKKRGVYMAMEVFGSGDMGGLILQPPEENDSILSTIRTEGKEWIRNIREPRIWSPGRDLIDDLFNKESSESSPPAKSFRTIRWSADRRVLIRGQQITVPFGEFWRKIRTVQDDPEENSVRAVDYCLLARDMELPVLIALFPSRPLFRIDANLKASDDFLHQAGSGMIDSIVEVLASRGINIWNLKNNYRSLMFDHDHDVYHLRSVEAHLAIIASVPSSHRHDSPDALAAYIADLRERILRAQRAPLAGMEALQAAIESTSKDIAAARSQGKVDAMASNALKDIERKVDSLIGPEFIADLEITGPAMFRCFLSHSVRPDYDEKDYIDRLKLLLESEVFEVVEGDFSLGRSTEDLSRGRIRQCDLFVSLHWPRSEFRTEKGEFLGADWVIHEESYAMGLGLPVYRVRERSVAPLRYEYDRVEFLFTKGDLAEWKGIEQKLRHEIRQLAHQSLLGLNQPPPGKKAKWPPSVEGGEEL